MKTSDKLLPLIEDFLAYRKTMGFGNSPHERYLAAFIKYCSTNHPDMEKLCQEAVIGWLTKEAMKENSNLSHKANTVRLFGKYLSSIGEDAYILPTNYASFKSEFTPYILDDSELKTLMQAADGLINRPVNYLSDPYAAKVMPVLMRLLYTCGLRPSEGRLLKRCDINFETGEVLIRETKRYKDRIVVMSDDMLALCREYYAWRMTISLDSEYFFSRYDGNPFNASWLYNTVRTCWRLANPNIPKNELPCFRPYDLRHRFASAVLHKWINERRDLYAMLPYLRVYMGHANMESTACYIHILPETLLNSPGVDWDKLDTIVPEVGIWED
jgi:integrase/recombinase XerD